jgi:pimeloyl-ACP methyl ester carboxylesterase
VSDVPVVLLHGFATSARRTWHEPGWVELVREAGRPVVAPDLPGHGDGPKHHDPAGYADLEAVVASQLPDGPLDAIGYSMGARVLLAIAAGEPGRFRRLVLGGVGRGLLEPDGRAAAIADAVEGRFAEDDLVARHFHDLAHEPGNDPAALAALLRRPAPPLTAEMLSRVQVPVLVVIGSEDFGGPGEPLAEALPLARLVTLAGVDHHGLPKSYAFVDAALEFIGARPF